MVASTLCYRCARSLARSAWVLIGVLAASGPAIFADGPVVVEDFEALSTVRVTHGQLLPVRAGGAVSHGKQAAKLPAGAWIHLVLADVDRQSTPWLKIDTWTTEPLIQKIRVCLGPKGSVVRWPAYVQPGRDTLCVPLSAFAAHLRGGWPAGEMPFELANVGQADLIVDYVRLEPAAKPPPECVLMDFGPPAQRLWPGFQAAGITDKRLSWGLGGPSQAGAAPFGDPLTGDYVGTPLNAKPVSARAALASPGRGTYAAWAWVTHYVHSYVPAPEHSLRLGRRAVVRRALSARQALGPDCLLHGLGGAWTPQWLARVHAPQFYERAELRLTSRTSVLHLTNCQIAALAMAPARQKAALAAYAEQVEKDLARYRRQFVLGRRVEAVCRFGATEAESERGWMLFQAPADAAFQADWVPAAGDRARTVQAKAANGSLLVVPVALAPTEAVEDVSVSLVVPSSGSRPVATDRPGPAAWLLERVANVVRSEVRLQPWVLTRRLASVRQNEVVWVGVVVPVAASARAGAYQGAIRLKTGRRSVDVPLTLEVLDCGRTLRRRPPVVAGGRLTGWDVFSVAWHRMNEFQQNALTAKLRRHVLDSRAFDSLVLAGPSIVGAHQLNDEICKLDLRTCPTRSLRAPVFFGLEQGLSALSPADGSVSAADYRTASRSLVARTKALASRYGVRGHFGLVGMAKNAEAVTVLARHARAVASAGGRPAVRMPAGLVLKIPAAEREASIGAFAAVLLNADAGLAAAVQAVRAVPGTRAVYACSIAPARYATGFYAAAGGADGVFVLNLGLTSGHYDGCRFTGWGLLAPRADGEFAETLAMLRLLRGFDDFLLFRRAEALLDAGSRKGVPVGELKQALEKIRTEAAAKPPGRYDTVLLRSVPVERAILDGWRESLLQAAQAVAKRLGS